MNHSSADAGLWYEVVAVRPLTAVTVFGRQHELFVQIQSDGEGPPSLPEAFASTAIPASKGIGLLLW